MGRLSETYERGAERYSAGDLDGMMEFFDESCQMTLPGSPTASGKEAVRGLWQVYLSAFPGGRTTTIRTVEEGDTVCVEERFEGTNTGPLVTPMGELPATGKSVSVQSCNIVKFNDAGNVVNWVTYLDQVDFMTQLGLMPQPAAATAG
jgi:predicted ester cyclase